MTCVDYECGWKRPREPNPRTVLLKPGLVPGWHEIAYLDVGADYSGRDIWVIDAAGNPQQLTDDIELIGPNSADDLFWSEDGQ